MWKRYKAYILVLAVLIVSRLLLFGVGVFVSQQFKFDDWARWDSEYYLQIAENGYDKTWPTVSPEDSSCNQGTGECQRNFAFFPVYPATVSVVNAVFGVSYLAAGWMISNLLFVLAGVLLFRLAKRLFNREVAWLSLALFAFYPFGYIFSAVMTESLFIFLLILSYSLAFGKHYLWAGVFGFLLAATRNTGVLFVIPLLLVYLEQQHHVEWHNLLRKLNNWKLWVSIVLVGLGLVLFMNFLYGRTGDAFAFINIQKYWEKPVLGLNPMLAIPFSLVDNRLEGPMYIHIVNLVVFAMLVGFFMYAWKRKQLPWSLTNIFIWILVPLSAGSMLALPRYSVVIFPMYLLGGLILSKFPKAKYFILPLCLIAQLVLTYLYVRGSWLTV